MGFPSNWETCREAPGPGPPVADTPQARVQRGLPRSGPAPAAGSGRLRAPGPAQPGTNDSRCRWRGWRQVHGTKLWWRGPGFPRAPYGAVGEARALPEGFSASPTAPARCSPQPGPPRARARTSPSPCSAAGGGARRHHTAPRLRPRGAGRSAGSGTARVSARPAGPKGPPRGSRGQKQPPPTPAFSNFPDVPRNRVSKRTV